MIVALAMPWQVMMAKTEGATNVFVNYLKLDKTTTAEMGLVVSPDEINEYRRKIQIAAQKDPKWFKDYAAKNKPGLPFSFDEKMGLTKKEHEDYLALWDKRSFKVISPVEIKLIKSDKGLYSILGAGPAAKFAVLKYDPAKNVVTSPKGILKRLPDINADARSVLGAWTGHEWKFEKEDDFATVKENFAIGTLPDKKHGILIYRFQELSSIGPFEESILIRFLLKK